MRVPPRGGERGLIAGAHRAIHVLAHASPRASATLRDRMPRLDTIGVGAVVLATLLEMLDAPEAEVVSRGFREGVVLRELDRAHPAATAAAHAGPARRPLLAEVA